VVAYLDEKKQKSIRKATQSETDLTNALVAHTKGTKKTLNNRMSKIMQMIKSSSFYASVHQVFFQIDNSEVPIYLELVHNTDDD